MHLDISVLPGLFVDTKGECADGGYHRFSATDKTVRRVLLYADTDAAIQQAPKEVDVVFDSCVSGGLFVLETINDMGFGECDFR